MSFNLHVNRLNAPQKNDGPQVENLSNKVNDEEDKSIFARSVDYEIIDNGSGSLNGHDVGDFEETPTKTMEPKTAPPDRRVNIDANPTDEKAEEVAHSGDTFACLYDVVHDIYGHDLEPKEYLQIMYAIITDENNAELFKDFTESAEFKKFEEACLAGDEQGLQYATGIFDGATEDIQGIYLPDVDIY